MAGVVACNWYATRGSAVRAFTPVPTALWRFVGPFGPHCQQRHAAGDTEDTRELVRKIAAYLMDQSFVNRFAIAAWRKTYAGKHLGAKFVARQRFTAAADLNDSRKSCGWVPVFSALDRCCGGRNRAGGSSAFPAPHARC